MLIIILYELFLHMYSNYCHYELFKLRKI